MAAIEPKAWVLSKRYGINQKTVAKWKKRTAVKDLPTGPVAVHSTVEHRGQETRQGGQ